MHFGGQEIWVILIIVLLLFGGKKIPELGKSLGLGIKEFKKSTKALTEDDDDDEKTPKSSNNAAS